MREAQKQFSLSRAAAREVVGHKKQLSIHQFRYGTFWRQDDGKLKAEIIHHLIGDVIRESERILDAGCGKGEIKNFLEQWNQKKIIGLDPVCFSQGGVVAECEHLPFLDSSFDLVILNGVYFYIQNPDAALAEIARILQPGGYLFLTSPLKFVFCDTSYRLLFISWLPKPLADIYLRVFRGDSCYNIRYETYGSLFKRLSLFFRVSDLSLKLLNLPQTPKCLQRSRKAISAFYPLWKYFHANVKFLCQKPVLRSLPRAATK